MAGAEGNKYVACKAKLEYPLCIERRALESAKNAFRHVGNVLMDTGYSPRQGFNDASMEEKATLDRSQFLDLKILTPHVPERTYSNSLSLNHLV